VSKSQNISAVFVKKAAKNFANCILLSIFVGYIDDFSLTTP
jgi:hypothetical protein